MKETTKTSRTAGYLEKIFRKLNAEFFAGEQIEEPIITIQNTPDAYGHVTVNKAWRVKGETKHELNIGAGTLDRPIENVCATMLLCDSLNRRTRHTKKQGKSECRDILQRSGKRLLGARK